MKQEITTFEKNFVKSWEDWDQDGLSFIFIDVKLEYRLHNICKCLGMPEGLIDLSFDLENLLIEVMVMEEGDIIWSQKLPVNLSVQ